MAMTGPDPPSPDETSSPAETPSPDEPSVPDQILPSRPGRYARLRLSIGRHPADLFRLALAAGVVLAAVVIARSPGVNPVEASIFNEVERLPLWTTRGWKGLTWLGWWPGIVAAAGVTLYRGRIRLGIALTAAGVLSWVLSLIIHWLVGPRPVPPSLLSTMLRQPGPGGFAFPSAHVAVAAALVAAAAPYLRRLARNTGWALVVLVGVADVFLGTNLPLGAFAGAVLGWGTGVLFHLVLGAPGRKTSELAVEVVLRQAGLDPDRITRVQNRWLRPLHFEVVTNEGEQLDMKIVRRLHRLAGPSYKVRRLLASLEVEHQPGLSTPRHEVEHEAYVSLMAERAGVGTVPVFLAGEIEHGPAFLITRRVPGTRLSELHVDAISDGLLDAIWRDVEALRAQHIAHHDLRAGNILVDEREQPRIIDFTFSRVGGPVDQCTQDAAAMLVSIASVVGVSRAVESAHRALSAATLRDTLPYLQTLAMHGRLRNQLAEDRVTLSELRETVAERVGCPVPPFRSPVRPVTVGITLAVGLAVYLLLPQLSSLPEVVALLGKANRWWLGVSVATGFLAIIASALTLLGSSPVPLPFGKTVAVQVAAAFTGRTTAAGIGFYGINIFFLERLGLRRVHAVGVLILNRALTGLVTAIGTVVGILVIGAAAPVGPVSIPTGWPVRIGAIAFVVVVAATLASSWGRRRLLHPAARMARELARDLLPTLRQPVRAAQLLGGSIGFLLLSALGLATTLQAFTPDIKLIPVLAVYVVGSTLGQLAPTPGGLGTVEAALVGGLTAIGVHPTAAVAAVLTSRLLTFWLPAVPGLVTFRLLQHHGVV